MNDIVFLFSYFVKNFIFFPLRRINFSFLSFNISEIELLQYLAWLF